MKPTSARCDGLIIDRVKAFSLVICILVSFTSCASMSAREAASEIRISGSVVGADIQVSPPLLRVEPGQNVTWTNNTNYEIQINFESDQTDERPSLLRPFSAVRGKFEQEGTYSYTLVYSSSKTFGRVTGTIVVGNPPQRERSPQRRPKEVLPPEETPGTLPEII